MKPVWRQIFDAAEQAASPMLQEATASAEFAEVMKVSTKMSRDFNRRIEVMSRQWLHLWNLPAAGDVSSLKKKIGSLENEVRTLQSLLERQTPDQVPARPSGEGDRPVEVDLSVAS